MTNPYPPWLQQQIQLGLQSGDQSATIAAAKAAAKFQHQPPAPAIRRMFDAFYTSATEINDHIELQLSDQRQALPAGRLVLKGNDILVPLATSCMTTVVGVIYDKGNYRWSGRIDVAHAEFKGGLKTVTCELIGDKHWLDRILCWPNPFLPVWIQAPAEWFGIGPGLTVMATLIQEQAWRIQSGVWNIFNNIGSLQFAWQEWVTELQGFSGLTLADILSTLYTPICVVPINPLTDTSAWIEINGRMDTCWKLIQQQLLDNGFDVVVRMWLPGEEQPPGLIFPLTKPTVVVQFFDRSNFTGPFGPFEGLVVDLVQLEGSLLGNALQPLLGGADQPYVETDLGEFIAPNIGVNFTPPNVILDCDVDKSGIVEYAIDFHHPLAFQVVTGGQSPKWINDLINASLEWLIDAIMMVIGFTGLPDNILDGIFDNVLFAFSLVENYATKAASPFMFPEKFFPSGAGSLTLDTLFAEAIALWNVRGYPSGKISFIDGFPITFGVDVVLSQLVFYVYGGQLFIDYVEGVQILDNRTEFDKLTLQIGDGKSEEPGMTKVQRKMVGLETFVNIILSGGNPSS